MSYGRTISFKGQYYIDNERLEKVDTIKDLGLTFDTNLKFREHIIDKVNKAYSGMGIIKRNVMYLSETSFCIYIMQLLDLSWNMLSQSGIHTEKKTSSGLKKCKWGQQIQ